MYIPAIDPLLKAKTFPFKIMFIDAIFKKLNAEKIQINRPRATSCMTSCCFMHEFVLSALSNVTASY